MTESEWGSCGEPEQMLEFAATRASPRKMRLFACGCCRRVWHMLHDKRSRRAVIAAENFADDGISSGELEQAHREAWKTWEDWPRIDARTFKAVSAAAWVAKPTVGLDEAMTVLQCSLAAECRMEPVDARVDRCDLMRELFGNLSLPLVPDAAWLSHGSVLTLSRSIYEDRRFEDMPILGDALDDAGCVNPEILNHCRGATDHVRGCWLLDAILGRS